MFLYTAGKIVYEALGRHLTPVTLEMGRRRFPFISWFVHEKFYTNHTFLLVWFSPVYLDNTANIAYSAKKFMWDKLVNMG